MYIVKFTYKLEINGKDLLFSVLSQPDDIDDNNGLPVFTSFNGIMFYCDVHPALYNHPKRVFLRGSDESKNEMCYRLSVGADVSRVYEEFAMALEEFRSKYDFQEYEDDFWERG